LWCYRSILRILSQKVIQRQKRRSDANNFNSNSFQKSVIYRSSNVAGPIAYCIKVNVKFPEILKTVKSLEDLLNAIKAMSKKATDAINKLK